MKWFPAQWLPVAMALLTVAAGVQAASPDDLARSETVDDRLGLFDETLRIWKVPRRYTAGRSPYFQPGLPPYRQQPERAEDQVPPEPEPETVATPDPPKVVATPRPSTVVTPSEPSNLSDSGSSGGGGSSGGSGDQGGSDIDYPGSIGY